MAWLNIDKACTADVLFLDMVWSDDESLCLILLWGDEAVQSQLIIASSNAARFLD